MLAPAALALALAAAPVTHEELARLGQEVAADLAAGKDGFTPRFEYDGLLDRALEGVPAPAEMLKGFRTGAKKAPFPLGAELVKAVEQGGDISYRKVARRDGVDVAMLRLLTADGAFNYHELHAARGRGGKPRVVDVYVLTEGSLLSANVRRLALMGLGEANQGLLDRLAGKEQVFLRNVDALKQMTQALGSGQAAKMLEIYDKLPKDLQEVPVYMRQSVYAAVKVDEQRYRKQMARYIATFPDDPAGAVMAVDAGFLAKDWDAARKALDVVERRVGDDDGWIEVLRANVDLTAGNYQRGMGHFATALKREPGLRRVYPMAVGFALQQKEFGDVSRWLTAWEKAGQQLADLRQADGFQEFVASREGQAFLKRKPAR